MQGKLASVVYGTISKLTGTSASKTNLTSKSERGRGMAAAALVPIWNVNQFFATTIQQRWQHHVFPENMSGLLASQVIGTLEHVDSLPLTMPHSATRFVRPQFWTTDDADEALRRAVSHHHDEICTTRQVLWGVYWGV